MFRSTKKYHSALITFKGINKKYPAYALFIHHTLCTSKVTCRYGEYSLLEPIVVQHANILLRDTERFMTFLMRDGSEYAVLRWRDWYVSKYGKAQCQGGQIDFYNAFNDSLTMIETWVKQYRERVLSTGCSLSSESSSPSFIDC